MVAFTKKKSYEHQQIPLFSRDASVRRSLPNRLGRMHIETILIVPFQSRQTNPDSALPVQTQNFAAFCHVVLFSYLGLLHRLDPYLSCMHQVFYKFILNKIRYTSCRKYATRLKNFDRTFWPRAVKFCFSRNNFFSTIATCSALFPFSDSIFRFTSAKIHL